MACPHVSGAAGKLTASSLTRSEVDSNSGNTAEDIGLASNEQEYGLVDAAAALGYDSSDGT